MIRIAANLIAASAFLAAGTVQAQDDGSIPVAAFEFELIDTNLQAELTGPDPEETRRTEALDERLRQVFAGAEGIVLTDMAPIEGEAARRNLQNCDVMLAGRVGAEWWVTGTAQTVSNPTLNINILVREVDDGELVQAMSADVRGNTDECWRRGPDWLIRNRLGLDS